MAQRLLDELARILAESGPWLLLGFALAAAARAFLPTSLIRRRLGARGFGGVFRAALLGVPMPACSCSVIPLAVSLRKHGASRGATASFAIAAPETGPDTIALTWGLIGPALAIIRPLGAFLAALLAGSLINLLTPDAAEATDEGASTSAPCPASHCACAAEDETGPAAASTWRARLLDGLRYAFVELPADISLWLLAGLLATAAIGALLPPDFLEAHLGRGLGPMLLALVAGLPMYVCASASTPVVAILIAKGLSPGAALVFLLAGPATNLATMAWALKDLGARALAIYVASIAAVSLALGLLVDALLPTAGAAAAALAAEHEHAEPAWRLASGALALALLLVGAAARLRSAHRR